MSLSASSRAVDAGKVVTVTGAGDHYINDTGARSLWFWLSITAFSGTSPTFVGKLQWSPDNGTTWIDWDTTNLQTTSLNSVTTVVLKVGPGLTNAANSVRGDYVPARVRLAYTIGGTTPSFTFSTWYTATD
jgi:predicted extracellular nuclease